MSIANRYTTLRQLFLLASFFLPGFSFGAAGDDCQPAAGLEFVCGMNNAEDLEWLGDTGRMIVSGLAGRENTGHLYLFDPETRAVETIFPGENVVFRHDRETYPACSGKPDLGNFSPHGISVAAGEGADYRLYLVAHGARESVEVFNIDYGADAGLTWVGCVEFPGDDSINSVAALPGDAFLVTRLSSFGDKGLLEAVNGEETGFVYRWSPAGGLEKLEGSRMSGPNGIVVSPDGEMVHVASWGHGNISTFTVEGDGSLNPASKMELDFRPDNLRLTERGTLLAAGHRLEREACPRAFCVDSWGVAEIDPASGAVENLMNGKPMPGFMGPTVALDGEAGVWLGTFGGDRIALIPASGGR